MEKILNNLLKKLQITKDDILNKLNIEDKNISAQNLFKELGIYSVFGTKEDHQNYIIKKLANKEQEINKLRDIETNYLNLKNKYDNLSKNLNSFINNEWKNISDEQLPNLKIDNFDFLNLKNNLIKLADDNNLKIKDNQSSILENWENKNKQANTYTINDYVFAKK